LPLGVTSAFAFLLIPQRLCGAGGCRALAAVEVVALAVGLKVALVICKRCLASLWCAYGR